jgi:hypothetical protein
MAGIVGGSSKAEQGIQKLQLRDRDLEQFGGGASRARMGNASFILY